MGGCDYPKPGAMVLAKRPGCSRRERCEVLRSCREPGKHTQWLLDPVRARNGGEEFPCSSPNLKVVSGGVPENIQRGIEDRRKNFPPGAIVLVKYTTKKNLRGRRARILDERDIPYDEEYDDSHCRIMLLHPWKREFKDGTYLAKIKTEHLEIKERPQKAEVIKNYGNGRGVQIGDIVTWINVRVRNIPCHKMIKPYVRVRTANGALVQVLENNFPTYFRKLQE